MMLNNNQKNASVFSVLPFPPLSWWSAFFQAEQAVLDNGEHFEKMSFRNRYFIGAANGSLGLSIPLKGGRNQRLAMHSIQIAYADHWQKNHWQSIVSAYNKTPFFEFYEDTFKSLYQDEIESLSDWNLRSIQMCCNILKCTPPFDISETFIPPNPNHLDTRQWNLKTQFELPERTYFQPFQHKHGFLPNLSILDLICCEGPNALAFLK